MLEQTVFTPFQTRLQVIGPYAVFFRNMIYCQHTSIHREHMTIILVVFPLAVSLKFAWNEGKCVCAGVEKAYLK